MVVCLGECSHVHLRVMSILLMLGGMFEKCQVK